MYDKELAVYILRQVLKSSETILVRFEPVKSVDDFTSSSAGMEKFDSICMLIITIGESLKNWIRSQVVNYCLNIHKLNGKG